MSQYTELIRRSRELGVLNSCAAVLGWDQQTYMPTQGANLRGEQMALLASLSHQKFTDPKIGELLAGAESDSSLDDGAKANVRELRRGYDRATKLPPSLVEELARVTTQAQQAWQTAKAKNDFATFCPFLEKVVALKRQEADAVGFKAHPYDALIEEYDAMYGGMLFSMSPTSFARVLSLIFTASTAPSKNSRRMAEVLENIGSMARSSVSAENLPD